MKLCCSTCVNAAGSCWCLILQVFNKLLQTAGSNEPNSTSSCVSYWWVAFVFQIPIKKKPETDSVTSNTVNGGKSWCFRSSICVKKLFPKLFTQLYVCYELRCKILRIYWPPVMLLVSKRLIMTEVWQTGHNLSNKKCSLSQQTCDNDPGIWENCPSKSSLI